ncbi:MAG TPA: FtsX-like permease family protein [Bacteroidales bacterium]|nr:FtsX-like permease family protein [Bacteroidales bacterium]HOH21784.1 FtsX-like permease family protein [Bacteroidales bacterium]HPZ02923.1 FtsX-like permease family protein [Bacteroidales bacterium]HQB74195.1 FtsX-like permease family protein [Bacteroidales bacterium]
MRKYNFQLPFFIAKRYLFSKKKHNFINVISLISMIGIMVSSAALIIVLSVFNGLQDLVEKSFNQFNPDYVILPKQGKVFDPNLINISQLEQIKSVKSVEVVFSDMVLLSLGEKQALTHLKGVDSAYPQRTGIDTILYDGFFNLNKGGRESVVLGAYVAGTLDLNLNQIELIKFYYPNRTRKNLSNPLESFNTLYLPAAGVFLSHTQYDEQYVFVPIEFARELTLHENEITSLEIFLKEESTSFSEQKQIQKIVGDQFVVKNKYEQEELLFKTMKSEKLIIFIILSFVILMALFNIIGVIGMLIVEKREDIEIMTTMGMKPSQIHTLFLTEGVLISLIGGLAGLFIGSLLCWIQQTFKLIQLGPDTGSYIISHYPVLMQPADFFYVLTAVVLISFAVSAISIIGLKKIKTNQELYR